MNRRNRPRRSLIAQDFAAYRESITQELHSVKNRVRNLIGSDHWGNDGEHKESAIRNVLRPRLPFNVWVGKGFVCFPIEKDSSGQIDILVTSRYPPLYQEGDLAFVIASAVEAVAEIKTKLSGGTTLDNVLNKLAEKVQRIRANSNRSCWAGLFIYEQGTLNAQNVLEALQRATNGVRERVIDCVSVGHNLFVHFWDNGSRVNGVVDGPVWHSYDMPNLAPAYFVSNIIVEVSPDIPEADQIAWFSIDGGKETKRRYYAALHNGDVLAFD